MESIIGAVYLGRARYQSRDTCTGAWCKKWRYIDTILQSWRDNGITTLEDVRLEELAFKDRKNKGVQIVHDKTLVVKRNIPDWFKERKVQHARHHEMLSQEREKELERVKVPKYTERTRQELEGLLKGFGVARCSFYRERTMHWYV